MSLSPEDLFKTNFAVGHKKKYITPRTVSKKRHFGTDNRDQRAIWFLTFSMGQTIFTEKPY